jgi:hypothetical protein
MDYETARYLAECIGEQIPMNQPEQPTLRDRFAMAALQGIFSNPTLCADIAGNVSPFPDQNTIAIGVYSYADAMMKVRSE